MNKDKIRNILNLIFMIGAVVGVILYLQKNEQTHMMGLYIILIDDSAILKHMAIKMIYRPR